MARNNNIDWVREAEAVAIWGLVEAAVAAHLHSGSPLEPQPYSQDLTAIE